MAGKAVIASRLGGVPELIERGEQDFWFRRRMNRHWSRRSNNCVESKQWVNRWQGGKSVVRALDWS